MRVQRTGSLRLPVAPERAFTFFTPEGERAWAPGWEPEYLHPEDGTLAPGLLFRTTAGGEPTFWAVLTMVDGEAISYARIVPNSRAGVVTVECDDAPGGGTLVTVSYDLTATSEAGKRALGLFTEAAYAEMLREWEIAITRLT